jgi:16S rRNA G1207 methylase RsmC
MGEHYFSEDAGGDGRQRTLAVTLAGREVEVVTAGGVFSADRLDLGTSVLLRADTQDDLLPAGGRDLLDLGCGWGPLALTMAIRRPAATVWALDVNRRAVDLTAQNARRLGLDNVRAVTAQEMPHDLRFDAIWSNPPIRIGKAPLHDLLGEWLVRLAAGGCAHLVVQRHLGADSLQAWLTAQLGDRLDVRRRGSSKGFRVLQVCR